MYGIGQDFAARRTTEAQVYDVGTLVYGVRDSSGYVAVAAVATVVQHLDRHQARSPGNAGHTHPVVGTNRGDPRHVSAVTVIVVGRLARADEIVTGHQLARTTEIGMIQINPGVNHGDDDVAAPGGNVPGSRGADFV